MQYTENYQYRKPVIGIDVADVKDINFNSDKTDTLIHNTQISLAPAYDLNETYDTGDVVMYETLMYKCKADNTTGAWDASKWERTTAGEEGAGGGGSSVVPNPSGTPTDTLNTIGIDGTIFDIAGSSGGGSAKVESIWQGTANQTGVDYTTNKSIEDYDYLIFKFRPVDLTSETDETELFIRDVNDLTDYGTDTFACVYFQNAYVRGAFSDDTTFSFSIISSQGATAIILYEIQGLKLGAGGGTGGGYSETSLYTYTGSTRQTTLSLSDAYTDYDAIEFTFGWNLGGTEFETVNVISSSKIVSNVFVNVGGEGRYNYVSRGGADDEIILATATGSWDGSSIIREVRGINY